MFAIALPSESCNDGARSDMTIVWFLIRSEVMAPSLMSAVAIVPFAIFAPVTAWLAISVSPTQDVHVTSVAVCADATAARQAAAGCNAQDQQFHLGGLRR